MDKRNIKLAKMEVSKQREGKKMTDRFKFFVGCIIAYMVIFINANFYAADETQKEETIMHQDKIVEHRSGKWSPNLSLEEKNIIFKIAEDTLQWCVKDKRGDFDFSTYRITDKLRIKMATFVTLKKNGALRGCIGSLAPVSPLFESVHDNTVNAALEDFRFTPVQPAELSEIELHVSILSPIIDIASLDEFIIGEHGIIVEKGFHKAVYLPEVAIEQGWNKEETLSSLCLKAGMGPNDWKKGARFKIFSSVVLEKIK